MGEEERKKAVMTSSSKMEDILYTLEWKAIVLVLIYFVFKMSVFILLFFYNVSQGCKSKLIRNVAINNYIILLL